MEVRQLAKNFFLTIAMVFAAVTGRHVYARQDIVPGSRYTSARGSAMGDALIPIADDGLSAIFYNPAVLSRLSGPRVEVLNIGLYGNVNYFSNLHGDFLRVANLSQVSSDLLNNRKVFFGSGYFLGAGVQFQGFSFGVLLINQFGAQANLDTSFRYRTLVQLVPAAGFGFSLFKERVRVGYSLQWVHQASGDVTDLTPASLSYYDGLRQGSGLSHNVGISFSSGKKYIPEFHFVGRNILGLEFTSSSLINIATGSPGAPATEPMTFDFALRFPSEPLKKKSTDEKITTKKGRSRRESWFTLSLQMRDLTGQSGVPTVGRFAGGVEILPFGKLALRAGYGTGYPSLGVGYRFGRVEVNATWYTEDIGTYHEYGDERFVLQFQLYM